VYRENKQIFEIIEYFSKLYIVVTPVLVPRTAEERRPEVTMETIELVTEETQPESQKPTTATITPLGWPLALFIPPRPLSCSDSDYKGQMSCQGHSDSRSNLEGGWICRENLWHLLMSALFNYSVSAILYLVVYIWILIWDMINEE